ncbi:PilZ domain-containing protein [Thalassoglobus sp. JC818]|uniref:PilZ domain-containing protein n=1 Tax=Thalassoglobus sp. JC818 TaxID=3232136 RepID=UPI003458D87D
MKLSRTERVRLERLIEVDACSNDSIKHNRRLSNRVPVRLIATLLLKHEHTRECRSVSLGGRVLNLSKGGAMIAMDRVIETETVFIRFLSEAAGPNVIQSRLVHSSMDRKSDHPHVYGVEFQKLLTDHQFAELLRSQNTVDEDDQISPAF